MGGCLLLKSYMSDIVAFSQGQESGRKDTVLRGEQQPAHREPGDVSGGARLAGEPQA